MKYFIFKSKIVDVDGYKIKARIWRGKDNELPYTRAYYRNIHCLIIVFDLSRYSTFTEVRHFIDNFFDNLSLSMKLMMRKSMS